ncbi:GNAT family N-acetyltransferase [Limnoraphis robusta]|uniref:GNAT family N-acetyltransferase n=1 Tax=Limnoraphis robusta CCNP1315 TaxID=3110306 RepID=A0ABU5TS40_9CYAN|nr:GNAT family N-acetyltransferase [Limnoraphis robusta]MEA5517594.1 GNAT family N-acetyltransferase [Limnoraphis robusta CCNP1315]MEA5544604.1 GNAT family N-acetyltransferase [Limnoraphis robusta CCNP1324]
MSEKLITTYLEMTDPAEFKPAILENLQGITIFPLETPDLEFYRFLYDQVGNAWRWRDRLLLSDQQLTDILADSGTSIDVLYVNGAPAGYIELSQCESSTEIAYFGLRSGYCGRGLGKYLLSYGITKAWNQNTQRLWVHTCNLDNIYALDNYLKRGFKVYKVEEEPLPKQYL